MSRFLILLMLLPSAVLAQRKFNLTLMGGFSNYTGDLQEKKFTLDQSRRVFGGGLSWELLPKILLHGTLKKGKVGADDKFSSRPMNRDRNLNFTSNIWEAALTLDYSFYDLQFYRLSPYVFAGGALFRFNPITKDREGRQVALRNLSTEGQGIVSGRDLYRIITISVPFGAGVRMRVSDNIHLGYEIGVRKTFTDYIDDVSSTYISRDQLLAARGLRAVQMAFRADEIKSDLVYPPANTIRGGSKYKDWYYFSGITLSIGLTNTDGQFFGKKVRRGSMDCPPSVL
jgi:hypothetical protein